MRVLVVEDDAKLAAVIQRGLRGEAIATDIAVEGEAALWMAGSIGYDAISDERDTDLAVRLTRERGIASIPVSVFYREPPQHRVLRFCFAKSEETLARGAEILRSI